MSEKLKDLIAASDNLEVDVSELLQRKGEVDKKIAVLSAPFKVGDLLRTATGLGAKNGLKVHEVVPPVYPREGNRWVLSCFALTKEGVVSARAVRIEECMAENDKPTLMKD